MWLGGERGSRSGIYVSPTRGLVEYLEDEGTFREVATDDPRLEGAKLENVDRAHVELGPTWAFLTLLSRTPLLGVLREELGAGTRDYQRALAHLAHTCLAGARGGKCGDWLEGDVLSWLLPDVPRSTLNSDVAYFRSMGDDGLKVRFFKALVGAMRQVDPEFGRCCYVDSTPLPGQAKDNPFVALSSHGTDGCVLQARLALVLDAGTGVPVWFEVTPSNVPGRQTVEQVRADVEATLGVTIDQLDLDAGYACRELLAAFNRDDVASAGEARERRLVVERRILSTAPRQIE